MNQFFAHDESVATLQAAGQSPIAAFREVVVARNCELLFEERSIQRNRITATAIELAGPAIGIA